MICFPVTNLKEDQKIKFRLMGLLYHIYIGLTLLLISSVFFGLTDANASVSGSTSYSTGLTNPLPIPIPVGTSVSVSISYSITGSATITAPSGGVAATMGMSGGTFTLSEVGTYKVSESYHLEMTGTPNIPGQSPSTITDDASSEGSFSNSVSGAICTFQVSSYVNLSVGEHSDNISVSVSPSGASATAIRPIMPGESAHATININWGVKTTTSIENPPNFGSISVNTNLDEASFSISGPASYGGSGRSWSVSNAPAGTYTITYNPVTGYQTPPSDTKTLNPGGSISFSGIYTGVPQVGSISVSTNLDEASFSISGPASYSGSGKFWSVSNAPAGMYTITYNSVTGYQTPASEIKTLAAGSSISFTGTYIEISQVGNISMSTNLDAASFSISGPASYSGSGKSWLVSNAPVGTYTITYNPLPDYQTPASETKTLTAGSTIYFTGIYAALPAQGGTIEVHTNLDAASFSISGPASYSGSGKSWSVPNAPAGIYTITYNPVTGYQTPPSEAKTLVAEGSIGFSGTYTEVPQLGGILVVTNLDSASFSISGPVSYRGSGKFWSVPDAPAGTYTITYNDVFGYQTPDPETKTLVPNGTITFTGTYSPLPQTGTIRVSTNLYEASFKISGPVSYSGSGKSWSVKDVPAGKYTITYNPVPAYKTPASETQTLSSGGTIVFTGMYIELQVGTIVVNANIDAARYNLAGPQSRGGIGKSQTWTLMPLGTYTITYESVTGYNKPEQETKELVKHGDTITFTGIYTPYAGTIIVKTNLDAAVFSLSGPENRSGNGKSQIFSEMPLGTYTITFEPVAGYNTPQKDIKTLVYKGETISFNGIYASLPPAITMVEVSKSPAKAGDNIVISMYGSAGGTASFSIVSVVQNVAMTESKSKPGFYTGKYVVPEGLNVNNAVVKVKLVAANGMWAIDEKKTITIDSIRPVIKAVSVIGSPARKDGDIITVKSLSEAGAVAKFSIDGVTSDTPMQEETPGDYVGYYKAIKGMNLKSAKLIVKVSDTAGNTSVDESKTVSIRTAPWDINSDRVVDLLDIKAIGLNIGMAPTIDLDINEDNAINALDLVLVGLHFGEKYGIGGGILAAAKPLSQEAIAQFLTVLPQNYPNPFNPDTWIPFVLSKGSEVYITIYNSNGQLIRRLDMGYKNPGIYISKDQAAYWDGRNESGEEVASGVYFYHITSSDFSTTGKMLISK